MDAERQDNLVERVSALERVASEYRLSIAASEQMKRQRRYELLQAAATLLGNGHDIRYASLAAYALLAEIEKQEKAEAQS